MVRALLLRSCSLVLALLGGLALSLGSFGPSVALGLYDNPDTAEGWAWSQIKNGDTADFNARCRTPRLDPRNESDPRWQDNCRRLPARFLQNIMTQAPWREAAPSGGIGIGGAVIVGDLDLTNTRLIQAFGIDGSRIEGKIDLTGAQTDSLIEIDDSLMSGEFSADNLHSEGDLNLRNGTVFKNKLSLGNARIGGRLVFEGVRFMNEVDLVAARINGQFFTSGASFEELNAGALEVGGNLLIGSLPQKRASFKAGIFLVGARIAGSIVMDSVSFEGPLNAGLMQVGGSVALSKMKLKEVVLSGARIAGQVVMTGTRFDGTLDASLLDVGGNLSLQSDADNTTSFKRANFNGAKISQEVLMTGARFDGVLQARSINVGSNLSMRSDADNLTSFKEVDLTGANIKGDLDISGTSFDGKLSAETLHVDGNLLMQSNLPRESSFKEVDITGTTVKGNVSMIGAGFDGSLIAGLLRIGGNLYMGYKGRFKQVSLPGSKVEGAIFMSKASFGGLLDASLLQAGGGIDMHDSNFAGQISMNLAHIGGDLDLRGAGLAGFDLSGASIAGDLKLTDARESALCKGTDCKPSALDLRNAHIGGLMEVGNAWPSGDQLHVADFAFGHLGGPQMRDQGAKWWDDWARRDPDYSPSTYAQLAAAFTNAGNSDAADDIRYFRREREREMACKEGRWGSCLLQTTLGAVAGYGIGSHTFKVIPWVLVFWAAGALLLWWTVPAAKVRGVVWCSCASLAQLLPVVTINKELTEFFNDPERKNLKGWQVFLFSALGVVGLALGAILLLAVSGLTHSS